MTSPSVRVTFIDASSGQAIGMTDVSPDQLPQSFEAATTMHLRGEQWSVEKADPVTAAEFVRTGALTLTLRRVRVMFMNPRNILFTLPTLDAAVPTPDPQTTKLDRDVLELHEDDWRQVEFVGSALADLVQAELVDIARIFQEESINNGSFLGFKNLHMRRRPPEPLPDSLTASGVHATFSPYDVPYGGIAFRDHAGVIAQGFAFRVSGFAVYGREERGWVRILGLHRRTGESADVRLAAVLGQFMSMHSLYLIDWCRTTVLSGGDLEALRAYVSRV